MTLSPQEADLFHEAFDALLAFVQQRKGLEPAVASREEYSRLPPEKQVPAREALYAEPALVDEYLSLHGPALPEEHRALVDGWRRFLYGDFTVVKALKAGAVLAGGPEERHYLVLGLRNSLDAVLAPWVPPARIRTALLPFRGRIVYDGLVRRYPDFLDRAGGKKVHAEYLKARRKDEVVTTLEPRPEEPPAPPRPTPRLAEAEEILRRARALQAGRSIREARAYGVLVAAAALAAAAARGERSPTALQEEARKVKKALARLHNALWE